MEKESNYLLTISTQQVTNYLPVNKNHKILKPNYNFLTNGRNTEPHSKIANIDYNL